MDHQERLAAFLLSPIDKNMLEQIELALKHNKFASIMFRSNKLEGAEKHFLKALEISDELGIPYTNVMQNLGNLYAQKKDYILAEEYYRRVIEESPSGVDKKYEILAEAPETAGHYKIMQEKNLNSQEAYIDAHTNLSFSLLGQGRPAEATEACRTSLRLKYNREAHINFGNSLRQCGRREEAVEFVTTLVEEHVRQTPGREDWKFKSVDVDSLPACQPIEDEPIFIITVKWGTKYDSEYVNKLYRGFCRHTTRKFTFICFTDDSKGLDPNIQPRSLIENWTGWWGKASIFSAEHNLSGLKFFIDLDMIITGSLDEILKFPGKFALMRTDEISCETQNKNGYNSSVILWRDNAAFEIIYKQLKEVFTEVTKYIYRFDYWLEMTVRNSEFVQDLFPGQIRDYTADCTGDTLPPDTRIVAFPRDPKPHEVKNCQWLDSHWK